ncbi:MAG TPA: flagellar filament capping protein FliD [Nitrospira sp.]|nr:flagellar filament capping protein FliD [Nitrospira sp.]
MSTSPTVSFGGLGNGFDYSQVINALVQAASAPLNRLTQTQSTLSAKSADYTTLTTKLQSLQSATSALSIANYDQAVASVSDPTVMTATAASTATTGNYIVQVSQLAQAHQITDKAATAVASTTANIVNGSSAAFSFTVGAGSAQTVNLSSGASIQDLQDAINNLGAGVTASIINTGSDVSPAYRLVLTSNNSGSSNAITVTADGTALDFLNSGGSGGTDTLQAAQDARIQVGDPNQNPITVTRSGNTISDAIPGVTLNLTKTTGSATVNVNVTQNAGAVQTNIKALVTAYNDVVTFINSKNTYNTQTNQGGTFFAEGTPGTVLSSLRQALNNTVSGTTTYATVGQIGFSTNRDGTITIDDAALTSALNSNYADVKALLVGQINNPGIATQISNAIDSLDDVEAGAVTLKQNTITDQISNLTDQIAAQQEYISQYQQRLQLQYAQLDSLLSTVQGQLGFLTANANAQSGATLQSTPGSSQSGASQ